MSKETEALRALLTTRDRAVQARFAFLDGVAELGILTTPHAEDRATYNAAREARDDLAKAVDDALPSLLDTLERREKALRSAVTMLGSDGRVSHDGSNVVWHEAETERPIGTYLNLPELAEWLREQGYEDTPTVRARFEAGLAEIEGRERAGEEETQQDLGHVPEGQPNRIEQRG